MAEVFVVMACPVSCEPPPAEVLGVFASFSRASDFAYRRAGEFLKSDWVLEVQRVVVDNEQHCPVVYYCRGSGRVPETRLGCEVSFT